MMMEGGFSFGIPGLGMVAFWGAIILLVDLLARSFSPTGGGNKQQGAREILDERYARREIDPEEYTKRSLGQRLAVGLISCSAEQCTYGLGGRSVTGKRDQFNIAESRL
jgi:putative membrane protein